MLNELRVFNPILPEWVGWNPPHLFINFTKLHFAEVFNNHIQVCQVFHWLSNDTKFVDKNNCGGGGGGLPTLFKSSTT